MTNETADTVALAGVPETMLWPLWNRAMDSRRSDRLVHDPMAEDLVEKLDYDFAASFRRPTPHHAIRARVADDLIAAYLARGYDDAVVVSLGEGVDTQLWRVPIGDAPWVSVDLPEAIAVREKWLPTHANARTIARSALDLAWMDEAPASTRPFIVAAGLLMYFTADEVETLLRAILDKYAAPEVFFDTITPYFSAKSMAGLQITPTYTVPSMPWGIANQDVPDFIRRLDPDLEISVQPYHLIFKHRTRLYRALALIPGFARRYASALVHVRRKSPVG